MEAQLAETHISVVVFIGDRAYKLKKSVHFGFVDLSTREARERLCHREVELNRRLAPDVYLGVADVVDPNGELCDHLVVMRRMPDDRRLATLVTDGAPSVPDHLREIARQLASFHTRADRGRHIDEAARAASLRDRWTQNFDEMRRFVGPLFDEHEFDRVEYLALRYVEGREELFADRIEKADICDGHGDLQCADIFCLDDGPRILDCIEFDDRFRHVDVVDDIAFLAMDLERLGHGELARFLLAGYEEFSGEHPPDTLLDHYIAYRALVRAKVAALRWSQEVGGGDASAERDQARGLLGLCRAHLERGRVRLVLVGGLPGTGKSTLARGLADMMNATVLRTDDLRRELAGLSVSEQAGAAFGEGIYTAETKARVYDEMIDRAGSLLRRGESVILDASWSHAEQRARARTLAERAAADLDELCCEVDADVAARRLASRLAAKTDSSDATPAIATAMAAETDPWPEADRVPTTTAPDDVLARVTLQLGVDASR